MNTLARAALSASFAIAVSLYGTTSFAQAPVKVAGGMLTNDAGT